MQVSLIKCTCTPTHSELSAIPPGGFDVASWPNGVNCILTLEWTGSIVSMHVYWTRGGGALTVTHPLADGDLTELTNEYTNARLLTLK